MLVRFFNLLKFTFSARHTLGFRVHSPFVFYFLRYTVYANNSFYIFKEIEKQRLKLKFNKDIKTRWGKLLFRTAHQFNPENIVEIGAKQGISTTYLAANSSKSHCITLGKSETKSEAEELFKNLKLNNITYCEEENDFLEKIKKQNKIDLLFISENIISVEKLIKHIFPKFTENTIIIINKQDNKLLYEEIANKQEITAIIDLFYFNILFMNKDLHKKTYKAIYL
jgi:hypothetical protein